MEPRVGSTDTQVDRKGCCPQLNKRRLRDLRQAQSDSMRSESELCIPKKTHSFTLARHRHTFSAQLLMLHSQSVLRIPSWMNRNHYAGAVRKKKHFKAATPESATLFKRQLLQSNSFESASSVSCLPECPTPDIAAADEPSTAQCPSFACPCLEAHLCFHMNFKA